jgi:hypothetical protein
LTWSRTVVGAESAAVATDAAGSVFLAGKFEGTVDFDPSSKKKNVSVIGESTFVLKLTSTGNFGWVSTFNAKTTASLARATDLVVDGGGNIIVSGTYEGQVDFNPHATQSYVLPNSGYGYDAFLTKLNSSGGYVWSRQIVHATVNRLAMDSAGSVYVIGSFTDFYRASASSPNATSAGGVDVFAQKFTAAGNLAWATNFGGVGNDFGYAIAVGATGKVYLTGSFDEVVDFDTDPNATHELGSVGSPWQLFLLELWQD